MTEPPEAEPSANGPLVVEADSVTRTFGPVVALAGVAPSAVVSAGARCSP